MYTYRDVVSEDGQINLRALMVVAVIKARSEREGCRKIGWERPWRDVLRFSLRLVWEGARIARACAVARAEIAVLPQYEQIARRFELKAELAENALPPRSVEAQKYHKFAREARVVVV
jgi:hypothetical protein